MVNPRFHFRGWLQFHLRTLLALVTILGVGLGFVGRWHFRALRQRDAILTLTSKQFNSVNYADVLDTPEMPDWMPESLRGLLTVDHFHDVKQVYLVEPTIDELDKLRDVPRLELLHLNDWSEHPELRESRSLNQLASLGQLKSLALSDVSMKPGAAEVIGQLRSLRALELFGCVGLDDQFIDQIARLPRLEVLQVDNTDAVHDLSPIQRIRQLKKLDLSVARGDEKLVAIAPGFAPLLAVLIYGKRDSGQILPRLGELRHLTNLKLHGDAALASELLSGFELLADLRTLQVTGARVVTDVALTSIVKAAALVRLEVLFSDANTTTDEGLAQLAQMPCLEELSVELGPGVTDVGLAMLSRSSTLRHLRIVMNDRVTGEGFANLDNLKFLQIDFKERADDAPRIRLSLPGSLKQLVLSDCADLSDDDLRRVSELKDLEYLNISECPRVTNAGIAHLQRLTRLTLFEISNHNLVTNDSIHALRKELPSCEVRGSVKDSFLGIGPPRCGPIQDAYWE